MLYYNRMVSIGIPGGTEWVSTELEEFNGSDWNGNTIQQLEQRGLKPTEYAEYASEIAELYFGSDGFGHGEVDELAKWVGEGGKEMAAELHRLLDL